MTELVRVEAFDAGELGTPSERAAEAVVAEAGSTLPQPEINGVAIAVVGSQRKVAAQRAGDRWSDRDDPAPASFAAANGDQPADEVEVLGSESEEFPGADAGLEHEPDDRGDEGARQADASAPCRG